ncbi:hypothetical protein BGZ65_009864 [Modicella reniformis]|uniref:Uncharacterized protein n=1 Tax=Modicella reniformis TaxID=1440133 RepID=A0A9P6ISP6_9FUNG|nr:hypothetical protein BGZ65_009864 [Modicella reniformis]
MGVGAEAETKPLPSLPDAAYPITVAYATRCTLEQLRQYFIEMTSLTLEIQITPKLSALATVPNLEDLFLNINGTFSGVFPFSTVLQNEDPRLVSEPLLRNRVVLGMVVFQAWFQDTSNVDDSDEDSDSISTGSIEIDSKSVCPHKLNAHSLTQHTQHTHDTQHIRDTQDTQDKQDRYIRPIAMGSDTGSPCAMMRIRIQAASIRNHVPRRLVALAPDIL